MERNPAEPESDWQPLATVPTVADAQELLALLAEAKIPATLAPSGQGDALAYTIAVPEPELPVASGVAEHFLAWYRAEAQGPEDDAEILSALEEPHEPEFAASLERERRSGPVRRRTAALAAVLVFAVGFALMALQVARWILG